MRPGSEIVSSGWDLVRASLAVQRDVTYKAAIGPRGVVEPSYDLRKAMLMNCTRPLLQSSILHLSIISSDSHMWVHLPAYLWGWACRPEVLSAPQGSEQRSLHRRWCCRTGWLPLCRKKRQKYRIYTPSSTSDKWDKGKNKRVFFCFFLNLVRFHSACHSYRQPSAKHRPGQPFWEQPSDDSDDHVM